MKIVVSIREGLVDNTTKFPTNSQGTPPPICVLLKVETDPSTVKNISIFFFGLIAKTLWLTQKAKELLY